IRAAANAGVVVVVSAGNDFEDRPFQARRPDALARGFASSGFNNIVGDPDEGMSLVIIAGSVDDDGSMSSFSNRALDYETQFLSALGGGVCCYFDGDSIYVDGKGHSYLFAGTSFSAPQIAGAVALLAQAFPALTGAEIVEILMVTAQDVGAPGPDSTFGMGIMDIHEAFQPIGPTSLAAGMHPINLGDTTGVGSPAMGDALAAA